MNWIIPRHRGHRGPGRCDDLFGRRRGIQAGSRLEAVLKKLGVEGPDAVAIGDTPYDAEAAGKAKIATVGVLCGGFAEDSLRQAGCVQVYPGPAALLACFGDSLLAK